MGLSRLMMTYFYAKGRPRAAFRAAIICTPLNVGLNIFLTPIYGMEGAALISSATYGLNAFWLLFEFKKGTSTSWRQLLWITQEDLALIRAKVHSIPFLRSNG
jgi:peptidoglycan biosynthesis protein MviN/MurJ (putative lipid II flippase)